MGLLGSINRLRSHEIAHRGYADQENYNYVATHMAMYEHLRKKNWPFHKHLDDDPGWDKQTVPDELVRFGGDELHMGS